MAKIGRPTGPGGKKSAQLSIRISPELRAKLEAAAKEDEVGRSLSQEIEARLRLSFGEPQRRVDEFGGPILYSLFHTLAAHIRGIEHNTKHRLWEDRYTFDECMVLIDMVMQRFKPAGSRKVPKQLKETQLGKMSAVTMLVLLNDIFVGKLDAGARLFNASFLATKLRIDIPSLLQELKR